MRTVLRVVLFSLVGAVVLNAEVHLTEAEAKEGAIVKPLPEYPAMARQLKVTGKVEIEVVIDETGKVEEVKIVSGNPMLTRPCAKTVGDWRFKAFQKDGKPSRAVAMLTFEFK